MCRLFGLMANKPVEIHFSMLEASHNFRALSAKNPDGWGIGGFLGTMPVINKSPIKAEDDPDFARTVEMMRSQCFVAHVRRATVATPRFVNTHPFGTSEWIFAHNGTIRPPLLAKIKTSDTPYRPEGGTDSEVYFSWLLKNMRDCPDPETGIRRAIELLLADGDYVAINFILARHDALYAFREARERVDEYTLYYVERKALDLNAFSGETRMLIEHKPGYDEKAVIVASEPLTSDEKWQPLQPGELMRVGRNLEIKKWQLAVV